MATSGSMITNKVDENTYFYVNWQQASQSVSGNYTDINWQHGVNCRYNYGGNALQSYGVGINGQVVYGGAVFSNLNQGTHELASGTLRIYHDTNGNKTFNVNTSGWVIGEGTVSGSQNFTLNKINRIAITNSVVGSDIEGTFKVNYTKYVTNYTYKLRIAKADNTTLDTIVYNTSGAEFTLSQSAINTLFDTYKTTDTFNLKFCIETYNGSSKLGSSDKTVTCKIMNADPIFTNFDFEDLGGPTTTEGVTTLDLTGNSKYNVNGYSTIRISISALDKAVAQKGASITKYQVAVGNEAPKDLNYSDSEDVYIDIPNSSAGEYTVYALDSRNKTKTVTKVATKTIKYEKIVLDKTNSYVERSNGGIGEDVTLNYQGIFWNDTFGNTTNTIKSTKYLFKQTSSNQWTDLGQLATDITPTSSGNTFSFSGLIISNETGGKFNIQNSYDFRLILEDELSITIVDLTPLSSGRPNISLNKNGVGIMCDYDETLGGDLQVGGKVIGELPKYKNEETLIGYWTDGNPLYRKIIEGSNSSQSFNVQLGVTNVVDFILVDVRLKRAGNYSQNSNTGSYWYSSDDYFNWYMSTPNSKQLTIRGGSNWPKRPYNYIIILEYTKSS